MTAAAGRCSRDGFAHDSLLPAESLVRTCPTRLRGRARDRHQRPGIPWPSADRPCAAAGQRPGRNEAIQCRARIEHLHATIGRARLVIAQVNPELPWTHGDTAIEPGSSDVLVPAAVPPMELPARPAGPIDRAVADPVARLIPDQRDDRAWPWRDSPGGDQRARPQARSRRSIPGRSATGSPI
jgi:hypothetical protein